MTVLLGHEIGMERIAREVIVLLSDNLSAALDAEDAKWATLDQQLAAKLQVEYSSCVSNKVKASNFYPGHRPSLIEASIDKYPNVSAMAYQSVSSTDVGDQYEGSKITLFIESMVIDGPYESQTTGFSPKGEDLINRKVQRMSEAIHNVMISNRTLGGIIFEISDTPLVMVTECMRRREGLGTGADYYWQMVRFEYKINKISAF